MAAGTSFLGKVSLYRSGGRDSRTEKGPIVPRLTAGECPTAPGGSEAVVPV
jgi:hypothetical protein